MVESLNMPSPCHECMKQKYTEPWNGMMGEVRYKIWNAKRTKIFIQSQIKVARKRISHGDEGERMKEYN